MNLISLYWKIKIRNIINKSDVDMVKINVANLVNIDCKLNNNNSIITIMDVIMSRDQRTTGHRVVKFNNNHINKFVNNDLNIIKNSHNNIRVEFIMNLFSESKLNIYCDKFDNVKNNCRRKFNRQYFNRSWSSCNCCSCFSGISNSTRSNSTTWLRLGSLLAILLVMSVQSAPTTTSIQSRRMNSPPKWVNPCGLAAEDIDGSLDVVQLRDEQLLSLIVVQARTALDHAQLFCDDYIKRTFNTDLNDLHSAWKDSHYDWLPGLDAIPKQLGEPLAKDYLDKLEVRMLDTALLNAYEYMQRYAVGLEQIVWDQEDYRLEFLKNFKETEYKLRTVLCELQVALMERGVQPRADVTRAAMSNEFRSMSTSSTYRNLRDWLIFRDYMNGLEYVVQIFEHLRRALES